MSPHHRQQQIVKHYLGDNHQTTQEKSKRKRVSGRYLIEKDTEYDQDDKGNKVSNRTNGNHTELHSDRNSPRHVFEHDLIEMDFEIVDRNSKYLEKESP